MYKRNPVLPTDTYYHLILTDKADDIEDSFDAEQLKQYSTTLSLGKEALKKASENILRALCLFKVGI